MPLPDPRLTDLPRQFDISDPDDAERLLPLVYGELRVIAARQMQRERPGHMLQPTALVHEAYLRLVDGQPLRWESRAHFFRIAARAMRQVLIDFSRRQRADKRGGEWQRVTLDPDLATVSGDWELLDLHEALSRLGELDPALERLVELRFFPGLTLDEAAAALSVSRRKAANDWRAALAWLRGRAP